MMKFLGLTRSLNRFFPIFFSTWNNNGINRSVDIVYVCKKVRVWLRSPTLTEVNSLFFESTGRVPVSRSYRPDLDLSPVTVVSVL